MEAETPLITEASSSGAAAAGEGGLPKHSKYQRRSDAIAYGTMYQKAAALVDLAEDGIGLPEDVLNDIRFERAAKFYFIYIRLDFLWSLNLFALVLLNFLEYPLWCTKYGNQACQERAYFFLGQLPYLTNTESLIYEGATLLILILHTFFPLTYEGCYLYWKDSLNKLKVILLLLLICDMLVYAFYLSPVLVDSLPFRIAPYIRVVFIILTVRELRACMLTLAGMAGTYLNVLALSVLFLLFASWLAYVTFEDTQQGKTMFTSYGETLYQMFVLFTTSNNPDVWIPAYKSSRWSSIFFVIYVLLGVYFLTNLILAVVYDSFKEQLAKQVIWMDNTRIRILGKAFSLIDNYINLEEFTEICNAIALKFQKEPPPSWFEKFPSFYHSSCCEKLKDFVKSPTFGYIIAFVLVLNLVAVVIETTLDIENSSAQKVWQEVEFFFGWLYVLEMALKIFSLGFGTYWMEGQNRFDFLITWIIDNVFLLFRWIILDDGHEFLLRLTPCPG